MNFFSARPVRLISGCSVEIGLQERKGGKLLPCSCSGVMVDISEKGTSLVLFQMLLEGRHLFFSTLDNEQYDLVLSINNQDTCGESFLIPARSVWMDSCHFNKRPAFKLSICFLEKQKKFFKLFKR
jgi:hypothetical protein